ncbi:MAG: HEAT repeat domain-containing protein [Polyangiales bacterium]
MSNARSSIALALATIAVATSVQLASGDAHAQRGRRPRNNTPAQTPPQTPEPARPTLDLDTAPDDAPTGGADADALVQAIQAAAVAGTAEGALSIARLLMVGSPPRAAAAGLDALGVLGRPEGAVAVLRFLDHRRATLRRHAVAAAQAIHTPELVAALAARLGDSDERVRTEAATALADVGGAREVAQAFAAFERDVDAMNGARGSALAHELAKLIARAGTADHVTRLLGFLRRAPLETMSDALTIAVRRADIPDPLKVRIVNDVGNLATPGVRAFLTGIADAPRECGAAASRAARTAADRISASE